MNVEKNLERKFNKNNLIRIVRAYTKNQKKVKLFTAIIIIVIIVNTMITTFRPVVQAEFVDILSTTYNNTYNKYLVSLALFVFLLFSNNILNNIQIYITNLLSEELADKMRKSVIEKLCNIHISYFKTTSYADFATKIDKDVDVIKKYGIPKLIILCANVFALIIVIPFMLKINIAITLGIVSLYALLPITNKLLGKIISEQSEEVLLKYKSIVKKSNDIFKNWMILKMFNCEKYINDSFNNENTDYKCSLNKKHVLVLAYSIINIIYQVFSTIIIWGIGGYYVFNNQLTIGTIMAFMGYQAIIINCIMQISYFHEEYNLAKASIIDFLSFIDEDEVNNGAKVITENINSIIFRDISFSYDSNSILRNVKVIFKSGVLYAIKGDSGTGKTTILNLIMGLISPQKGDVYLNTINISAVNLPKYWNLISYTSQSNNFFEDSIDRNIDLNEENDTASKEYITKRLDLYDEIIQMDNGWNTTIKLNPNNLSAGQLQRLDITRNLLKNAQVLLLDEPTANLDQYRKTIFCDLLQELKKDKIVIIVSHDKDVINVADEVFEICDKNCLKVR